MIRKVIGIVRGVKSHEGPSQTALTAAAARAAHLIVDNDPPIFADSLAAALLGEAAEHLIGFHRAHGGHVVLAGARAQVTCRSRYTEDCLARSIRGGVRQYVILGAGLDSFAYRCEEAGQVAVFEIDHPATQQWKRQQLAASQIVIPGNVTFVPVDFETDSLADCLIQREFDPCRPALVSWLGVTMYLSREAIGQTMAVIGGFAPGTELIADYVLPAGLRDAPGDAYAEAIMPVSAERGEPWLSLLAPAEMSALLENHRFGQVEHVCLRDAVSPALWDRSDSLRPIDVSRLARARVLPGR
jgi:methyltransferase (TIGR00027 family)